MVEFFCMAGDCLSLFPPCPAGSALSFATRTAHFPVTSVVSLPAQRCFSVLQFGVVYSPRSSTPTKFRFRCCRNTGDGHMAMPFATTANSAMDSESRLFLLFRQIGLNDNDTKALLLTNPALRFTPYVSIRNRLHSLQDLGVKGTALPYLILKRPDVITAEEVDELICLLLRNDDLNLRAKIEVGQIKRLLSATEPRFFLGFEGKVRLLLHYGIPQEKLPHVLNNANLTKALCLKSVQDIGRMFVFLNRFGGVDLILRHPAILNYDLDSRLIPIIGFFFDLSGGDEVATATVLRKRPTLLTSSVDRLSDNLQFLKSFAGLSDPEIFRIALIYPDFFFVSRRKLHPRIDFLKKCGLNSHEIFKFLTRAPLFIGLSFEENLAPKLAFLLKIGYKDRTKELAMAMGAVTRTSCRNMQGAIGIFLEYGLTCEEILEMSMKLPQVLQYNHKSMEEKLNYLIEDMGCEVGELLCFPAFLGYKLDSRIKRRYEATKKILGERPSLRKLKTLLILSTERFSEERDKQTAKMVDSVNVGCD